MNDRIVTTRTGRLRGRELPDGSALFAGVPFAAPPLGQLRLRPPTPAEPWDGTREATTFPQAPVQPRVLMGREVDDSQFPVGEDCLHLNVWVPPGAAAAPVLVWLYGGGFEAGSASPPQTDGAVLARDLGAVVVACNYRVGALGYLHTAREGREHCTNLGLQDQVAALRWVNDNIAAFGGDADNITVAGQSAGAFSIGALLAVPTARGTFHKAILHSGSAGRVFPRETATRIAADYLTALGVSDPDDLVDVPARHLLAAQSEVIDTDIGRRNLPGGRAWGVVLDGTVLPRDPLDAVAQGHAAHIPLLIAATRDETQLFQHMQGPSYTPRDEAELLAETARAGARDPERLLRAYKLRDPGTDLAGLRTRVLTDAIYRRPATRLAEAQTAAGGAAYTLLLSGTPWGPDMGACHGSDAIYLFDRLRSFGADTPDNRRIRDELITSWADFLHTGTPGWAPYEAGAPANTRHIGTAPRMTTEPPDDTAALW